MANKTTHKRSKAAYARKRSQQLKEAVDILSTISLSHIRNARKLSVVLPSSPKRKQTSPCRERRQKPDHQVPAEPQTPNAALLRTPTTPPSLHCQIPSITYKPSRRRPRNVYNEACTIEREESLGDHCDVTERTVEKAEDVDAEDTDAHGRRVVDLGHMITELLRVGEHAVKCKGGQMRLKKNTRKGLVSFLTFACDVCDKEERVHSEVGGDLAVNTALVCGAISIGIGHSKTEELLSNLNVPCLTERNFRARFA